jgi:eukaryotic-like serine/threonine-protein kinase
VSPREVERRLVLPYESVRTLYEGTSEVHLCRNEITGAHQVVKAIDTLGLDESVAVREATLLTRIEHPNILKVLDVAEDPTAPAPMHVIEMIMPFLRRGSVFDAFERGEHFSLGDAVWNTAAALRGLGELHERHRVLHRDTKSPNVFLADDGTRAKIGDLSIAASMESDGTAEAHPTAHMYTPPETYVAKRVGRSGDLYGLGLVLLEMANDRPFRYQQYTRVAIFDRLKRGRPGVDSSDLTFEPHVARRLRTVITRATHRNPQRRYQTALEMANALAALSFIDWRKRLEGDDIVWEGTHVHAPGRRFRVNASRKRDGAWRLTGQQLVTAWRRVQQDQIVPSLYSAEASAFFDRMRATSESR